MSGRIRRRVMAAGVLTTACLLAAAPPAFAQAVLAARVNGTGIAQERLERAFEEDLRLRNLNIAQFRNPERVKTMKRAVLDNLIEQELFWQAAQKTGTLATPAEVERAYASTRALFKNEESFEARLRIEGYTPAGYRELVKHQVSAAKYADSVAAKAPAVADAEVHRFYLDNPEKFHRPERVRARHILIKVAPGASERERAEKRVRIEQILKAARAGEDFAKLAREHSDAPTKQWGGEMDPVSRGGSMTPFEKAAFALAPGEVSDVLRVPEGFEILKVETHDAAITISEDQASDRIRSYLRDVKAHQALRNEIERLRASGTVEILLPF